jgi:hypothetical protein
MAPYHYSSLLREPDRIRLLRLLPDTNQTAPIHCQLLEYTLQGPVRGTHLYEALSYVWGDSKERHAIFINEHPFNVRENIYAALSCLRDRSLERVIWVDAVCINQSNEQEKEQQIQLMAKIYGQANRVVVWLGEATDDSDQALEEIRVAGGKKSTNSSKNETIQQAVLALLQRPWFRRIWVREQTRDNISEITKTLVDLGTSGNCRRSTYPDCVWFYRD